MHQEFSELWLIFCIRIKQSWLNPLMHNMGLNPTEFSFSISLQEINFIIQYSKYSSINLF